MRAPLTDDLAEAARVLRRGGLVAFPTETVYGLGADARHEAALERLFAVKGRPRSHPVIVHVGAAAWLSDWAVAVPPEARALARAFWPGPLTMILRRAPGVPDAVTGGQETVGLRMPDHPVALALLREFGGGIAAPSANRFGRLSPTRPEHVLRDLEEDVDLILRGEPSHVGVESTIVSLADGTPVILRPGHVRREQIADVLGREVEVRSPGDAVRASGTLPSHYAPRTPLHLLPRAELAQRAREAGRSVAVLARFAAPPGLPAAVVWREAPDDPAVFARELYATVRDLDDMGADEILVESVPEDDPAWEAVADRLGRAAARWPER